MLLITHTLGPKERNKEEEEEEKKREKKIFFGFWTLPWQWTGNHPQQPSSMNSA